MQHELPVLWRRLTVVKLLFVRSHVSKFVIKVLLWTQCEYQEISKTCGEHSANIKKFQSPAANALWVSRIFEVLRRTICEYQKISKWCCEYSTNFDFSCEYAVNYLQQDLVCANIHIMFTTISCEPICSQDIRSIFPTYSRQAVWSVRDALTIIHPLHNTSTGTSTVHAASLDVTETCIKIINDMRMECICTDFLTAVVRQPIVILVISYIGKR